MVYLRVLPLCIVLLITAGISRADAETFPFSPFTASYRGEANGITVNDLGKRSLVSLGQDKYRLEYKAEAMIYSLKETSTFLWENGIPKPLSYDSKRGTLLKKRENHLAFNWSTHTGSFIHKKKSGNFSLVEGIQDPLSSTLLLALHIQDGKSDIKFLEAKGKSQDTRQFVLLGTPEITTQSGKIKTYHLKRLHEDDKRHTELWLHFDYPFIPVKVSQTDEGDRFLLELTEFMLN